MGRMGGCGVIVTGGIVSTRQRVLLIGNFTEGVTSFTELSGMTGGTELTSAIAVWFLGQLLSSFLNFSG